MARVGRPLPAPPSHCMARRDMRIDVKRDSAEHRESAIRALHPAATILFGATESNPSRSVLVQRMECECWRGRRRTIAEGMTMDAVLTIRVSNSKYIGWVADELEKRLEGKLDAQVQPKDDRVIVVAVIQSESELPNARKTVQDELRGVMQVRGLDPLEQGKLTARVE